MAIFEPPRDCGDVPARFFESTQRSLDALESSLELVERPIYLAYTFLSTLMATNAFEWRPSPESPPAPYVRMTSRRGPFLGYLGVAEGALAFFGSDGGFRGNQPSEVEIAAALGWPWA